MLKCIRRLLTKLAYFSILIAILTKSDCSLNTIKLHDFWSSTNPLWIKLIDQSSRYLDKARFFFLFVIHQQASGAWCIAQVVFNIAINLPILFLSKSALFPRDLKCRHHWVAGPTSHKLDKANQEQLSLKDSLAPLLDSFIQRTSHSNHNVDDEEITLLSVMASL